MSIDQSNSRVTSERPARDTDEEETRPETTPTACSTGRVTLRSTSSGAAPGTSVRTVRVG
jgi:hypothetical protein